MVGIEDETVAAGVAQRRRDGNSRLLLAGGVVSSVLYAAMDVLCALRYDGYRYVDQAVSELNAVGAPTRRLFVALSVPYNLLLIALSLGIWRSSGGKRGARITAAMLAASAVVGQATPVFFPMDRRGDEATKRGRRHGPMTAFGSMFILLAMAFGAWIHGVRFRTYTFATMALLIRFGGLTALYIPRLEANRPTPAMGVLERVNIYAYLLWVAAVAASLWRTAPGSPSKGDHDA